MNKWVQTSFIKDKITTDQYLPFRNGRKMVEAQHHILTAV